MGSSQQTQTTDLTREGAMPGGLIPWMGRAALTIDEHIKDGRFQRSMALIAAGSSFASALEVGYEHYKGSYSNLIMYSPVVLSCVVTVTGFWGFLSRRAAERALRWTAAATLADGIIGFGFHVRGVYRKPGGWRLPLTNMIMGPPIFAPLLFGTAAYLGFMASYLRREEDPEAIDLTESPYTGWRLELSQGKFQKHLAAVAAIWTFFSGFEAWYSHFKSRFRVWAQWTPVILAPIQFAACIGAIFSERVAQKFLPAASALAIVDGTIGFGYHVRGVLRRPGGRKTWLYNILYGPPIFAPLLFAACGALGFLASRLRREDRD